MDRDLIRALDITFGPLSAMVLGSLREFGLVARDAEREYVHDKYWNELVAGIVLDETRAALENVVATMRDRDGIDGVILGGTELALIIKDPTFAAIPVLNTAQIHVEAGIDWLLAG